MSETTGRVTASRKNCQHVYEIPPGLLHKMSPSDAGEEIAAPADPELSESLPPASVAKYKRVRVTKENDSVSSVPTLFNQSDNHTSTDKDGRLARVSFDYARRIASEGRLG